MTDIEKARNVIDDIDGEIARLFEKRMAAVKIIAEYKSAHSLPVFDAEREKELIEKNVKRIENENLKDYYLSFLTSVIDVSKKYQHSLISK